MWVDRFVHEPSRGERQYDILAAQIVSDARERLQPDQARTADVADRKHGETGGILPEKGTGMIWISHVQLGAAVNREQIGLPEGHALQSHALMLLQEHLRRQRVDVARLHTTGVKRHGGQCRGKQNAGGGSRPEVWRLHAVSRLVM